MAEAAKLHTCAQMDVHACRNLLVVVWRDVPTMDVMRELGRAARTLAKQQPANGLINLFVHGTPRFTDEVRDEAARLDRDPQFAPLGIARVVLLPGLAGLAVRVFLNTVTLLARHPVRPVDTFGDIPAAAAWLAPRLEAGGQRWTAGDIVALAAPLAGAQAASSVA